MKKNILVLSAIAVLSLAAGQKYELAQLTKKWQLVIDPYEFAKIDSIYQEGIRQIDTITVFPQEIYDLKGLPVDSLDQYNYDLIDLVQCKNVEELKAKMKASLAITKQQEDSLMSNMIVVFDFEKRGVIRRIIANRADLTDTSLGFRLDKKSNSVVFYSSSTDDLDGTTKDSGYCDILYLDDDSLSLKIDSKRTTRVFSDLRPMNFIRFKQEIEK